jgi:hypothetical protein
MRAVGGKVCVARRVSLKRKGIGGTSAESTVKRA